MALLIRPGPPRVLRPPIRVPLRLPAAPRPFPVLSPGLRAAVPVLARAPGPLRAPGLALAAGILLGAALVWLWSWLNSRAPAEVSEWQNGTIRRTTPRPFRIVGSLERGGGEYRSCETGDLLGTFEPESIPFEYVGTGYGVRITNKGPYDKGIRCTGGATGPATLAEVGILGSPDGDGISAGISINLGGFTTGSNSVSDHPERLQVDLIEENGVALSPGPPARDPAAPVPQVKVSPYPPGAIPAPAVRPLPAPAPAPLPAAVPVPGLVPAPQPQPAPQPLQPAQRPIAPPITQPGSRPRPGARPSPGRSPGAAAAPGAAQAPGASPARGPVQFPSQDPTRPTQPVTNDGALVPTPAPPPPVTKPGTVAVGSKDNPITIVPRPVPATLQGIAEETGRIERKLEVLLGDDSGGLPQWQNQSGQLGELVGRLIEAIFTLNSGTTYTLSSHCEKDANGNPLPPVEVEVPGALNMMGALMNRMDGLAELLQVHKDLKQPSCKNPRPQGEPVTVNFEEI